MSESPNLSAITRFINFWAQGFSQFLTSLKVSSPVVEASEPVSALAPTAQEFESLVCIRFSGTGALKGELLWVAEKPAALQLAQLFKSEPLTPAAELAQIHRDTFAELLRQVASQVGTAWIAESGTQAELVFQSTVEPAPVTAQATTMRLVGEKFAELTLRLFLNEEFCASLSLLPIPSQNEPPDQKPEPATTPSPAARTTPLPANLGLVLDVELEATIRFGEREMLLRDIFGLIAGAVVELNQMVNEPAELLVAGRLVARGEVVVVDGNFGLRVTEVVSVNERVAAIQL
jgi:flagellar motor switch protein FliN